MQEIYPSFGDPESRSSLYNKSSGIKLNSFPHHSVEVINCATKMLIPYERTHHTTHLSRTSLNKATEAFNSLILSRTEVIVRKSGIATSFIADAIRLLQKGSNDSKCIQGTDGVPREAFRRAYRGHARYNPSKALESPVKALIGWMT